MKGIKRVSIFILLISALITSYSFTAAAASESLIIHHIESTVNEDGNSYTVEILLSVLDSQQQPIADLTTRDFEVSEDGSLFELENVEVMRDLPINVILVMDVSGSMQGSVCNPPNQPFRNLLKAFIAAIRSRFIPLILKLKKSYHSLKISIQHAISLRLLKFMTVAAPAFSTPRLPRPRSPVNSQPAGKPLSS